MNESLFKIHGSDAVINPGVDVLFFPKYLRGPDDEGIQSIDNPADVVRDPSGGV